MKEFCKRVFSKEGFLKAFYSFIWVAVLVIAVDLISKWCVQNNLLTEGTSVTLIPNFLHVTLIHNLGASFGMGSSGEIGWRIFWIIVSVVLTAVIIFIYVKYHKKFTTLQMVSITLMIGGAFGNMIDRIFYWSNIVGFDGVIDWIDFQFGSVHFATFNIADSCLVIGVLMIIIAEIVDAIKEVREKEKRGEYDLPPAIEKSVEKKDNADDKNK